jgi:flavin reductase (DIM6/NTAB) family NADH-FMN oxidoreductase RutF
MTINSFSSVSLEPSLVLFAIDNKSANLSLFKKNRYFSLNVLSLEQLELARAFATPKNSKKWGVEPYLLGKFGNPIFQNSLGFFECRKQKVIKAGDHHIIIGEVLDFGKISESNPLVYYRGKFSSLSLSASKNDL